MFRSDATLHIQPSVFLLSPDVCAISTYFMKMSALCKTGNSSLQCAPKLINAAQAAIIVHPLMFCPIGVVNRDFGSSIHRRRCTDMVTLMNANTRSGSNGSLKLDDGIVGLAFSEIALDVARDKIVGCVQALAEFVRSEGKKGLLSRLHRQIGFGPYLQPHAYARLGGCEIFCA